MVIGEGAHKNGRVLWYPIHVCNLPYFRYIPLGSDHFECIQISRRAKWSFVFCPGNPSLFSIYTVSNTVLIGNISMYISSQVSAFLSFLDLIEVDILVSSLDASKVHPAWITSPLAFRVNSASCLHPLRLYIIIYASSKTADQQKQWFLIIRSSREAIHVSPPDIFSTNKALRNWVGLPVFRQSTRNLYPFYLYTTLPSRSRLSALLAWIVLYSTPSRWIYSAYLVPLLSDGRVGLLSKILLDVTLPFSFIVSCR